MNIDEKDTELKEGQNPDDNSSQEACFVCHRPASKAGKMIHLTDEICICQDCMQKTLDMMNNGNVDYSKMDFSRMPNISMVNLYLAENPSAVTNSTDTGAGDANTTDASNMQNQDQDQSEDTSGSSDEGGDDEE